MAAMRGRPTLLQRFPNGAGGKSFFQKRVPKDAPDGCRPRTVSTPNGTLSNALVAADIAHIVWAVNLGCLGFHPWPFHDDDTKVDELRIDLDPQPGTTFDEVREAARRGEGVARRARHRQLPEDHRQPGHPRVRADRARSRTRTWSGRRRWPLARELERRRPDLLTAAWWKEERGERIFVDYNQNAPHKTVFGAWCVRARAGAQVSTPVPLGRAARIAPRRPHDRHRARPAREGRRPVGRACTTTPQSLEPLLALHRARPRRRADGRPVAARLPEAARRTAPGRSEPGEEGLGPGAGIPPSGGRRPGHAESPGREELEKPGVGCDRGARGGGDDAAGVAGAPPPPRPASRIAA